MKNNTFITLMVILFTSLTMISCEKKDAVGSGTIEINGQTYSQTTPMFAEPGSWNNGSGHFIVAYLDKGDDTSHLYFYFQCPQAPKEGDNLAEMSLTMSDSGFRSYYESGSAIITKANKSKNTMTVEFKNLNLEGISAGHYTINGIVTVDFEW